MLGHALSRGLARGSSNLASRNVARLLQSSHPIWRLAPSLAQSPSLTLPASRLLNAVLQKYYATTGRPKGSTSKKASTTTRKTKTGRATRKTGTKAKKKPAKKPTTRKRTGRKPKKQLTETEAKAKKVAKLRESALLNAPKQLPINAYVVLMIEEQTKGSTAVENARSASAKYRNLSASEREHYNNIANENKAVNERQLKQWIESYSPDKIRIANNARKQLNRIAKEPKPSDRKNKLVAHKYNLLKDERQLKQPRTPYMQFSNERWQTGDFSGISVVDVAKSIANEWKSLSRQQAQRFHDQYESEMRKYVTDRARLYTSERP